MDDLIWLDATAQAELVRTGQVTSAELAEAALARIDELNPALNAVVTRIDPQPPADGPFRGVPFLVKDLAVEVAGVRLSCGSRWLAEYIPAQDSILVERYRRAGLVLVGKANTCEFGLMPTCESELFGPARNPWAPDRSTGGSSGGSAAAVAAGLVPMAHGNDLGGSLRYPAAWCGVFALKPSRGRVPIAAVGDGVARMWADHALTRSVRDSARLLDVSAGPMPGDAYTPPPTPDGGFAAAAEREPRRLRIAFSARPRHGQHVDPDWAAAAVDAASLLADLGHEVDEGSPDGLDDPAYEHAMGPVYGGTMGWIFAHWTRRVGRAPGTDDIEPQTRAFWDGARGITAAEYLLATEDVAEITHRVGRWFERYDVWLTPVVGAAPPPLGELVGTQDDPFAGSRSVGKYLMFDGELANLTGQPAVSVPFGLDRNGLPVGIQCLGRFGDEATLLSLAAQLERARPWAGVRPILL